MQLLNLFAALTSRFNFGYQHLVDQINAKYASGQNRELSPPTVTIPRQTGWEAPVDSYQPTTEQPSTYSASDITAGPQASDVKQSATETPVGEKPEAAETPAGEIPSGETPVVDPPDNSDVPSAATYNIERRAVLDYSLTLQFDLATFTRTIESMADGELSEMDQITLAGFGLSTDFQIKGREVIRVDSKEALDQRAHLLQKTSYHGRQASMFQAQARDFQAQSFMRDATDFRRSIDVKIQNNARKAVNKFALRYRSDSRFSFSFAERFNVQTKQVAAEIPESLGGYVDSAGEVAQSGTTEMMTAFFDAVDAYLSANKDQVSQSVTAFFGEAAAALGFSGSAMAEMAEANLEGTIDSFFDQAQAAVDSLRQFYLGEPATPNDPAIPTQDLPVGETTEYLVADQPDAQPTTGQMTAVA